MFSINTDVCVYTFTWVVCVYACTWQKKEETETQKGRDRERLSEKWSRDCPRVPIPPGAEQVWQEVGASSHSQQHPQPQSMLEILWEACVAHSEISGWRTGGAEAGWWLQWCLKREIEDPVGGDRDTLTDEELEITEMANKQVREINRALSRGRRC